MASITVIEAVSRLSTLGVTFPVDAVKPASVPLRCIPVRNKLNRLSAEVISSGSLAGKVINGYSVHSVLEAVHGAYVDHRPLVLSPDHLWLTLCQGLAHHIQTQPELIRERLVLHDGRQGIAAFHAQGPVDWPAAMEQLRAGIAQEAPHLHDLVMQRFSTTGPDERIALIGILLEMAGCYFGYNINPICGIPSITLRGSADDWAAVAQSVQGFRRYGLSWWIDRLEPILAQFTAAARGHVDQAHWQSIYQQEPRCSVTFVSGWIGLLWPYIKNGRNQRCDVRNPLLSEQPPADGVSHPLFPVGVSKVHLRQRSGSAPASGFVSGFIGTTQHLGTQALEPRIGWGVFPQRDPTPSLDRLTPHLCSRGVAEEVLTAAIVDEHLDMPYDLQELYRRGDGGRIPLGSFGWCNLIPFADLTSVRSRSDSEGHEHVQPIAPVLAPRFRFDLVPFGRFHDDSYLCWAQRAGGPEIIFVWIHGERQVEVAVTLRDLVEALLDRSAQATDLAGTLRVRKNWPF